MKVRVRVSCYQRGDMKFEEAQESESHTDTKKNVEE